MIFYGGAIGFVVGIGLMSLVPIPLSALLMTLAWASVFVMWGGGKIRIEGTSSVEAMSIAGVGVCVAAAAIGGIWMHMTLEEPVLLDEHLEQEIVVEGSIVQEVDIRESHIRLVVGVDIVEEKDVPLVRVLVTTDTLQNFSYGSRVRVEGVLEEPEAFMTDTGRVFAYEKFLAKDDIYYQIPFAEVEVVADAPWSFRGALLSIKHFFLYGMQRVLPEPHAALGGGITVGARRDLGEDWLEAFRRTGLIHIVVLSGYNVTIVAEAIMRVLGFFPRRVALGAGLASISLFALMTGAGATIVRASIMAGIALIARSTGKTYALTRALVLAGLIMLVVNPRLLLSDPSFQLSFVATLGLIYVAPQVEKYLPWITERFGLREIIGATIGTQIAVLPLLLYLTGLFSVSALPTNVLVLPMVPLAMALVFVAGLAGALLPLAPALLIAYPAHIALSYMLGVVEVLNGLPFSAITLPPFPFFLSVLLYGYMAYFVTRSLGKETPDGRET